MISNKNEASQFSFSRSVWAATAGAEPESLPIEAGSESDVIVIGGGIAGAVATATLARGGARVTLLEAQDRLGSGATGRSGGFIVPAFPILGPATVIERLGNSGERLVAAVSRSADLVFDLIRDLEIDCDAAQCGWFQPTTSSDKLGELESDARLWQQFGANPVILDAAETERLTGASGYLGSFHLKSGGTLHPVKFVQGLVRYAMVHGARYHAQSPVISMLRSNGRWQVKTSKGTVTGDKVIICTNGQSPDLTPDLYRAVMPATICQTASFGVDSSDRQHLLGQGGCLSDTRVNLFTYRFDADWRLISGGIPFLLSGNGGYLGRRLARRLQSTLGIRQKLEQEFIWFGRASITVDFLPKAYEVNPGVYAFTACNGRGLALSTMFAHQLSQSILDGTRQGLPIPIEYPSPYKRRTMGRIGARLYPAYGYFVDRLQGNTQRIA